MNLTKLDAEESFVGSGHLISQTGVLVGACILRPGETFPNHYHVNHEETFVTIEGMAELWADRAGPLTLSPGSVAVCPRGVEHFIRNTGNVVFRAYFIKSPNLPEDRIDSAWSPDNSL